MNYKNIIEGLLFAVGSDGLTIEDISNILELDMESTINIINEMQLDFSNNRGLSILEFGGYYKLATKKEHMKYLEKLVEDIDDNILSEKTLEVLAIVAYNEPITRIAVDEIRGVSSSHIMRRLSIKGLIEEAGKADLPGRPNLYKTTNKFLDYFGLKDLSELPKINIEENVDDVIDEIDLYNSKYKETTE